MEVPAFPLAFGASVSGSCRGIGDELLESDEQLVDSVAPIETGAAAGDETLAWSGARAEEDIVSVSVQRLHLELVGADKRLCRMAAGGSRTISLMTLIAGSV